MSHEIRTPLNGIFGSLQVIEKNKSDEETVDKYSKVALYSYKSVIGIINDILDMSKIIDRKVSIFPEPNRFADLIDPLCQECCSMSDEKGIQLEYDISDEVSKVTRLFDPIRLGQIIRNLVSNAIKFTDQGKVTVTMRIGKQPDLVIITVRDTGVGIPKDKLDTIFDPFVQAEAARLIERRGTGLGLVITKELVQMMDGEITVTSEDGKGSTFKVVLKLPVTDQKAEDLIEEVEDAKPARLLLAEDVATNRLVFEMVLKGEPYTIDLAENGEIAVEMALKNNYDVIFMDIMMPKMDGVQALKTLKENGYQKPVIACTANVMEEDIASHNAAGFDAVINKPYHRDELIKLIQQVVTYA